MSPSIRIVSKCATFIVVVLKFTNSLRCRRLSSSSPSYHLSTLQLFSFTCSLLRLLHNVLQFSSLTFCNHIDMSSSNSPRGRLGRADADHYDLPLKELKAKESNHLLLKLTNASTNFSLWLFNIKTPEDGGPACMCTLVMSASLMLTTIQLLFNFNNHSTNFFAPLSDADYVIVVDEASRHPTMPGSKAVACLVRAFLPDTSISIYA